MIPPHGFGSGEYNPSSYFIKTEHLGDINRAGCDQTRKRSGTPTAAASLDHPNGSKSVLLLANETASSGEALFVLPALS